MSAVVLALATLSGSVDAAGLGRLTVQSALGQPLRAEVEVTSLTREEAASVSARLASPDAFRQAGLEFNPALSSLRFAVEQRGGRHLVRITSAQPINEPFVDLLVELNWAAGKFTREYTFLLDPPELKLGRESVEGGPGRMEPVVTPGATAARPVAARPTPAAAPAAPIASARPARAEPRAGGQGGIEVRRGDTLGNIARGVQPDGVNLDQAMLAIFRANPSAFMGNINLLKEGATLSVPDRSAMTAIDAGDARREVRVQMGDFAAYRARLAARAGVVDTRRAEAATTGRVGALVDEPAAASAAVDQLVLSKPGAEGTEAGGAVGSQASRAANEEQRIARDAALRESASRVADLERNVADLQKLLQLKNQSLADLQRQVDEARNAGRSVTGQVGQSPSAAGALVGAGTAAGSTASPAQAGVIPPAVPGAVTPVPGAPAGAPAPIAAASTPAAAGSAPGAAGGTPTVPAALPAAVAPAQREATVASSPTPFAAPAPKPIVAAPLPARGLTDELLENPFLLPGLGGLALLGAGYGWYAMRRRRRVEKFEDSLIAADEFTANSLFGSTGGQSVDTSQSIAGAVTTGMDVHATEVDPIAEADVYIAYGREAQAEEILKEALKRQPARQAIRLKLLEIFSGRKDARAFEAVAREMHEMTAGHNEEWPKVVTLGLSIDAENPLYGGAIDGAGAKPAAAEANAAYAVAGGLAGMAGGLVGGEAVADSRSADHAAEEREGSDGAADFDFPELRIGGLDDAAPQAEPAGDHREFDTGSEPGDAFAGLDFSLDLDSRIDRAAADPDAQISDEVGLPESGRRSATDLSQALGPNFEMPDLDLDPIGAQSADDSGLELDIPSLETLSSHSHTDRSSDRGSSMDVDLSPVGFDLEPALMGADEMSASAGGSGRWQEMATKLDLASAYEEIGDKEGARELLHEVVKGGDNGQQQKARVMLTKIG